MLNLKRIIITGLVITASCSPAALQNKDEPVVDYNVEICNYNSLFTSCLGVKRDRNNSENVSVKYNNIYWRRHRFGVVRQNHMFYFLI